METKICTKCGRELPLDHFKLTKEKIFDIIFI